MHTLKLLDLGLNLIWKKKLNIFAREIWAETCQLVNLETLENIQTMFKKSLFQIVFC